jgi:hypothetical protein
VTHKFGMKTLNGLAACSTSLGYGFRQSGHAAGD